jgi:hypothetical protein
LAEHGVDTGVVALRDVTLLSHGHVLIGSWGSTFTLIIQELIASRYREVPDRSSGAVRILPTVTYCDVDQAMSIAPLSLLASSADDAWQVSLADWPRVRLDINGTIGEWSSKLVTKDTCTSGAIHAKASKAAKLRVVARNVVCMQEGHGNNRTKL